MEPGRPDLSSKSNEELALITASLDYIREVRFDARNQLIQRGAAEEEIPAEPEELACKNAHVLTGNQNPVLYLRSFASDESQSWDGNLQRPSWSREEPKFLEPLEKFGPVVAIGSPGEIEPPRGGAKRLYAAEDWHLLFAELLNRAQLVVILAGTTVNLQWEIEQVFQHEPFVPTILLFPLHDPVTSATRRLFRRGKQDNSPEQAPAFRDTFRQISGLDLPETLKSTRVAYFKIRDAADFIEDGKQHWETLASKSDPYRIALTRALEATHPGISVPYIQEARLAYITRWVGLAILLVIAILRYSCA